MRIKSITIENFRGYKKFKEEFNRDSNIILIYGKNGYGKTSLFDSIEWCLTGDIRRIEEKDKNKKAFKNINSTQEGKVLIIFEDGTIIERIINSDNESILKQPDSEEEVKDYLFKKGVLEEKPNELFNFSYLLSQDLISDFIKSINPKERYVILAKLLGLSNEYNVLETLDEEQKRLRNIKKEKEKELNDLNEKLKIYSNDLKIEIINDKMSSKVISHELKNLDINEIDETLKKEVKELDNIKKETLKYKNISLILKKRKEFKVREREIIDIKNRKEVLNSLYLKKEFEELEEKKKKLDIMIKDDLFTIKLTTCSELDLQNKKEEYLEKKDILSKVKENFWGLENIFKDNKLFLETLVKYEDQLEEFKVLKKNNETLEQTRNSYKELTSKLYSAINDFIQNKTEINECPLCNNIIENKENFKKLVEKNLNTDSSNQLRIINEGYSFNIELIKKISNKLEQNEVILKEEIRKEILKFKEKIDKLDKILNNRIKIKKINLEIETKNKSLKIGDGSNLLQENISLEEIEIEIKHLNTELIKLENEEYNEYILYSNKYDVLQIENKFLSLIIHSERIQSKINELEELKRYLLENKKLENKKKIEEAHKGLSESLIETKKNIKEVDVFREAANEIIGKETKDYLEIFEQSVKKFYNYLTPQKNFPGISLPLKQYRIAQSEATLEIEKDGKQYNPLSLLSSAQKNNLALALFLGANLSSNQLKIDSIFMDDPIQNMDDINIYSFVEIIRRLVKKSKKQIIISTHDERIAQYMLGVLGEEIKPIRLKTLGTTS